MSKGKSIGGHQGAVMVSDTYLSDPKIIASLGQFDLDPCAPVIRPWDTAKKHYTIVDNGLSKPWEGRVWLNPPYGRGIGTRLERMGMHNNGIALIFARTETEAFHKLVFPVATSVFFFSGRLYFYDIHGNKATITNPKSKYYGKVANGGAPSVLIAYGEQNTEAIERAGLKGHHMYNTPPHNRSGIYRQLEVGDQCSDHPA